jgi:WD40 repeat protein
VPFEPADQHLFFGRKELSRQAVRQITSSDHTLITGASGAGKTSLVRAAINPALEREGHVVLTARPVDRDSVWKTLAAALARRADPTFGAEWLRTEERLDAAFAAERLESRINRLCDVLRNDRVVIVFDQFEELLRGDDQRSREFVAELGRLSSVRHSEGRAFVRVVIVMRDDLEAVLHALPPYNTTTLEVVRVGPMTEQQLREAVELPVQQTAFVRYEDRLVERIIDDVHVQPYSLPALQVILTSLWERQAPDGVLRHSVYQELNQGAGPLTTHLERVWHELGPVEQQSARRLFLHLVVPLSGGSFARRIASQSEVGADGWQVASVLATHRLVVLRGTPTGDATVELVHDALIEQWPTFAEHLDTHRDFLEWREDLRRRMAVWRQAEEQKSQLLTGAALNRGLRQLQEREAELGQQERHFLACSRDRQKKLRRRTAMSIVAGIVVVAVAIAASGLAVMRNRAAELAGREDLSRRLAARSQSLTESNPVLSSLLAAAAWQTAHTAEARYSMLATVHSPNRGVLDGHTQTTYGVAFSPDGKVLATTGGHNDETLQFWDVATQKRIGAPLRDHGDGIRSVAFSPDGKTIATGDQGDYAVVLRDFSTRREIFKLTGHPDRVEDVAFSPDGRLLATAGGDVRLWDVATGHQISPQLTDRTKGYYYVAFSPDGNAIATAGRDRTVQLWDVTGHPLGAISASAARMQDAAFNPAGTTLASAGEDGTVRLWDVASQRQIGVPLTGHTGKVNNVVFSPDGTTLASAGEDRTVRLWDVASQRQISTPLTGHTYAVNKIAFSPDGKTLASTSVDQTVRLWSVTAHHRPSTAIDIRVGQVDRVKFRNKVAFRPDGKTLATGGRAVRLWNVATRHEIGAPLITYKEFGDEAANIAFSPNGKILAVADYRHVTLWDVESRNAIGSLATPTSEQETAGAIAFSPDGKTLATASTRPNSRVLTTDAAGQRMVANTYTIRLWDVMSRSQKGTIGDREVDDIRFSPDGRLLATTQTRNLTTQLWDVANRHLVGEIETGHTGAVWAAVFSPDSKTLATVGDDPNPRLWDVASRRQIGSPLAGPTGGLFSVAFSPDGSTIATTGTNGDATLRLWDVATGRQIGSPLTGHTDDVESVAFSPDGKTVATGSSDETVRLWDVTEPLDLYASVCAIAIRSLTPTEWDRYAPGAKHQPVCGQ